ncbi:leucine-rich repeat-containing protein 73-like [Amphiura filiformis]|uniref:leucine-rich repeat-containing protein 73-like n=1 Tax=Amphiura filiformis TaxID=82378 RepID=UPI003B227A89
MLLGTVQISGETLSTTEVRDICESLRSDSIKLLSLRGCRVADRHFTRMMLALSECHSISQLNLNLGVVCNRERVQCLAQALSKNRSLTGLFLHGSPLGDEGLSILIESLALHPGIVSLDVGDCQLQDDGVSLLAQRLLPANGAKPGLKELTLSANPRVTPIGWANLSLAIAAGCTLRILNVDYNRLGDFGATVLAVATAACKSLQVLDLESTGVSENGAKVLLTLTNTYPTNLSDLVVKENGLCKNTERAISESLGQPDNDDDDEDDTSSSDEDESDDETPREKMNNRNMRRIPATIATSPRSKDDERYFERTAMRLLKRTASGDSKLPVNNRRRRESATESDSEYSSASSELEGAFLAQSELMRKTAEMKLVSHQKHAPLIRVPKPIVASQRRSPFKTDTKDDGSGGVDGESQDAATISESAVTPRKQDDETPPPPQIVKNLSKVQKLDELDRKFDIPKIQIVQPSLGNLGKSKTLVDGNGNEASQNI